MLSLIRRGGRLSSPYRLSSIAPRPAWNLAATRTMSVYHGESTLRPEPDKVLRDIADYVHNHQVTSSLAFETARLCLIDTIGCGLEGLRFEGCSRLLGPVVEGTLVPNGAPHVLLDSIHPPLTPPCRNESPRHQLPVGPYPRCLQHRHDDPVPRFQRLFPRCRV